MNVLFFGKKGHWATNLCQEYLDNLGFKVETHLGKRGDKFPEGVGSLEIDVLLSFSSPWIIPSNLLEKTKIAALNFHPGPPEYPGIGCTNFAIYNDEDSFGVTCHHMQEKVDTGSIASVRRFPIFQQDSVKLLTDRCYHNMYALFVEIVGQILSGNQLTPCGETWTKKPYTRKQLNDLCRIDPCMEVKEIARRVRATSFPGYPGAFLELNGIRFDVSDNQDET